MRKTTRKILIIVLSCVLLVSLGVMGYELLQYRRGDKTYDEAAKIAGLPALADEAEAEAAATDQPATGTDTEGTAVAVDSYSYTLKDVDLSALRKKNNDVQGWIFVPGTIISYPVVDGSERTDTYYLTHTWTGEYGIVGAIFIDPANNSDFSNYNTVIYGHNMRNGSMFGTLSSFASQSYWSAHKNIYITTDAGARCYQIFAAYEVSTSGKTYQISFSSPQDRLDFVDFCLKQSVIDTGVTPGAEDHIVTLSTCTGRGHATRWVVQAVLKSTTAAAAPSPSPTPAPVETPAGAESAAPDETGEPAGTETPAGTEAPAAETPAAEESSAPVS